MTNNFSAFLAVIRACEGTASEQGYRTLFGGTLFNSYDDHPRIKITASGYTSTAAGAYQILAGTWDDFIKANGPHTFTPDNQDLCARWLIARRGASADVETGRLEDAIAKCNKEWASLPGSPYGQPTRSMDYCRGIYRAAGGLPDSVGVTKPPVQDLPLFTEHGQPKKVNMDPLTIVSMLSSVFAPVIRAKLDKALGSDVGKPLADNLLAMAQTATGKTDPLEAVAVARQSPEITAKLQQATEDWLSQIAPLMDKLDAYERGAWSAEEDSRDRAGARGKAMQDSGIKNNPQFIMAAFIMFMVAGVVFTVLYRDTFSTDMQSFVIGAIVGGALTAVISYFFGSSRNSSAKDAVIGELAARR